MSPFLFILPPRRIDWVTVKSTNKNVRNMNVLDCVNKKGDLSETIYNM